MLRRVLPFLVVSYACATPGLSAQNVGADPTYGSAHLSAGFMPDPHITKLTAGGTISVSRGSCSYGRVADAPDVDLYFEGATGGTVYIYVRSSADVTLLVNLPSGDWVCDDDGYTGTNPVVVVPKAASGLYDIWVGTYGDDTAPAELFISELDLRN